MFKAYGISMFFSEKAPTSGAFLLQLKLALFNLSFLHLLLSCLNEYDLDDQLQVL